MLIRTATGEDIRQRPIPFGRKHNQTATVTKLRGWVNCAHLMESEEQKVKPRQTTYFAHIRRQEGRVTTNLSEMRHGTTRLDVSTYHNVTNNCGGYEPGLRVNHLLSRDEDDFPFL